MEDLIQNRQQFSLKLLENKEIKLPKMIKSYEVEFQLEHKRLNMGSTEVLQVELYNAFGENTLKNITLQPSGITKFNMKNNLEVNPTAYLFMRIKSNTDITVYLTMIEHHKPNFI